MIRNKLNKQCFVLTLPDDVVKSLSQFWLPWETFKLCQICKLWNTIFKQSNYVITDKLYTRDINIFHEIVKEYSNLDFITSRNSMEYKSSASKLNITLNYMSKTYCMDTNINKCKKILIFFTNNELIVTNLILESQVIKNTELFKAFLINALKTLQTCDEHTLLNANKDRSRLDNIDTSNINTVFFFGG